MRAKAREQFFFPFDEGRFYSHIDELISSIPGECRLPAEAFKRNLQAAVHTVTVPFRMAAASVQRRRFQALHTAERIRTSEHEDASGNIPEWAELEALEKARRRFDEEAQSPEQINRFADQILEELGLDLSASGLCFAATELLRQGAVLAWTAFEVLARDLLVVMLNGRPSLTIELMKDETARRLFPFKGVALELLAEYEWNLSGRIGDIFVSHHAMDTIPAMKTIYGVLLPNKDEIKVALGEKDLWILFQRRHLIVHRRGLVDAVYLSNTGELLEEGTELVIRPQDFERYLERVRDAGIVLMRGAAEVLGGAKR